MAIFRFRDVMLTVFRRHTDVVLTKLENILTDEQLRAFESDVVELPELDTKIRKLDQIYQELVAIGFSSGDAIVTELKEQINERVKRADDLRSNKPTDRGNPESVVR